MRVLLFVVLCAGDKNHIDNGPNQIAQKPFNFRAVLFL